jgi:pyruvate/2-oxoglutarate dehydrogenase complex dihydrolipoamide dehydrogenase (E3) component
VKSFVVPSEELDVRAPIQIHLEKKGGGERPKEFSSLLKCDAYLAAVGRRSNIDDLNLTAAGIKADSYGGLVVDSKLCTTASGGNIYGAGDVIGRPFLASTGVAQAAVS